jgi:hypothetical protein
MEIHVKLHGFDYIAFYLDYLAVGLLVLINKSATLLVYSHDHLYSFIDGLVLRISVLRQCFVGVQLIFILHLLAALIKLDG